jgi:hypothetical protein
MPTINVHCARCRRALRLPETALGKSLRCPRCGMVFTAKQKAPEVSSWVNYPVQKEEQPEAPAMPAPKPMKTAAPEPLAATEDPADLFGVLDSSGATAPPAPVAPEAPPEYAQPPAETADFVYADAIDPVPLTEARESLSPPTQQTNWGEEEARVEQEPAPYEEVVAPPTVDSSSDVFAAYVDSPKKKKKKKEAEPVEPEPEYRPPLDEGSDQPVEQPAEPTEEAAEAAEKPSQDVYAFAPEDDGGTSPGKSAMLWFIGGMVLGGLSAGGLGTLMMLKVIAH